MDRVTPWLAVPVWSQVTVPHTSSLAFLMDESATSACGMHGLRDSMASCSGVEPGRVPTPRFLMDECVLRAWTAYDSKRQQPEADDECVKFESHCRQWIYSYFLLLIAFI